MSNLVYVANMRLPTEKAHGLQIMKTCEALARQGIAVTLVVPTRHNSIQDGPFSYYGVSENFSIRRFFSLDMVWVGKVGFWIQMATFTFSVLISAMLGHRRGVVYYTRDEFIAAMLTFFGLQAVWEAHRGSVNMWACYVARKCAVVTITHGLKRRYEDFGARRVLVAPDAVDLEQFSISESKEVARTALGLEQYVVTVVYAGHLYPNKGAWVLAEAARHMRDIRCVFVGGTDEDLVAFRRLYAGVPNMRIEGRKPHKTIPYYLRAADMLVLPTSGRDEMSRLYTSPMKLFEYLASGTPILASDVPSLREILSEETAVFFAPDDPAALATAIGALSVDEGRAAALSHAARTTAAKYSWDARAKAIHVFIVERIKG